VAPVFWALIFGLPGLIAYKAINTADSMIGHKSAESATCSREGGALIPTIVFGVPGSAGMAIILGAFLIHGLVPGPDMLTKNLAVTYSMVWSIAIANIIGGVEQVPNPGALEFARDGRTFRIEALDEGEDTLFLVFADRTNGHGSYGAGRFIDAPKPDAQGRVAIDFNQAYNPPCAFTAFATCPLPPPENRLDLAVTAGEKAYRKPDHS